jgi:shikimate dehydrogenase
MHLGLIGYPLTHSFSPQWYQKKFDELGIEGSYRLFPIQSIAEFPGIIRRNPLLSGINVTIPYKEQIIPFLDALDPSAAEVGAVNTITVERSGDRIITRGYNTDVDGFGTSLTGLLSDDIRALILGTGGASRAVAYCLKSKNIPYLFVSRYNINNQTVKYSDLNEYIIISHRLIINTTPLGMFPDCDFSPPIPYQFLTREHILYDLIYNPAVTQFSARGKAMGCVTVNGLQMLYNQAESAFRIFRNHLESF